MKYISSLKDVEFIQKLKQKNVILKVENVELYQRDLNFEDPLPFERVQKENWKVSSTTFVDIENYKWLAFFL